MPHLRTSYIVRTSTQNCKDYDPHLRTFTIPLPKSKVGGVPHLRTSTLSDSAAPTGDDSWGALGICVCDMIHIYVLRDSSICVTCR